MIICNYASASIGMFTTADNRPQSTVHRWHIWSSNLIFFGLWWQSA